MGELKLSETAIQELLDKQQLTENMLLYARGVDRQDVELIKSTFWPDAVDDHGSFVGGGAEFSEFAVSFDIYSSNHHVSNILSEIEGVRAKRESKCLVVTVFKTREATSFLGMRYRDLCEKRDGVWKVLRRTCVWDWCEETPSRPAWDEAAIPEVTNWGAFYPKDPIHAADWGISAVSSYARRKSVGFGPAPQRRDRLNQELP